MNEVDEHMEHAGRQLQAMLSAALAIVQAVAERRDRAVRDAARAAGVDAQEIARRAEVDRLTQAHALPTPAEVAGRGPLSARPARSTADVVDGLRATDVADIATAWAAHTANGVRDPREWDDAMRAVGADPDRARADALRIKADVVDPAVASRDAAHQVEDLVAARVVVAGDHAADWAIDTDHTAALEQLHGPDWAGHVITTGADGAAVMHPTTETAGESGPAGAWQHGAEAPRLAGMAQTTRAGRSSLPGQPGSQLRRGQRHTVEAARQREPDLDR
jgi:hypothetical protein